MAGVTGPSLFERTAQRCRDCFAPVYWLENDATRRIAPIDLAASEGGNVVINLADGTYSVLNPARVAMVKACAAKGVTGLHTSHFATCPNAAARRR